jgi:HD-GYP domain-containing protein (c-di-GMP phosphodiesterase class II)
MKDEEKTRAQLLEELAALRQELDDLQTFADPEWRRQEKWRQNFKQLKEMLEGAVAILECRVPNLIEHQRRVTHLACAIARELGLATHQIEAITIAGMVHDIGKVFIPLEILNKSGVLNAAEMALVQAHPRAAHYILKDLDFSWPVAEIIVQHHERLDGSGYPDGLGGEEILLEARILAVPDVVEAMAYGRPHRVNLGINTALQEISRNRGILYDPQVVDACLDLFHRGFDFL